MAEEGEGWEGRVSVCRAGEVAAVKVRGGGVELN